MLLIPISRRWQTTYWSSFRRLFCVRKLTIITSGRWRVMVILELICAIRCSLKRLLLHQFVKMKRQKLWCLFGRSKPKLQFFGWRFLLNRLASKDNLAKRNILTVSNDPLFIFCQSHVETLAHGFGSCPFADNVWHRLVMWLVDIEDLSFEEFKHYFLFIKKIKNGLKRKIGAVVWLLTVWSI